MREALAAASKAAGPRDAAAGFDALESALKMPVWLDYVDEQTGGCGGVVCAAASKFDSDDVSRASVWCDRWRPLHPPFAVHCY